MNTELWLHRFDEHLRLRGYSERTREGYGYAVRSFLRFLEDREVSEVAEVSRGELEAYRIHIFTLRTRGGAPLSLASHAGRVGPVLSFLRYLYEEGYILANPGHGVKLPKVPDKLLPPLPGEDEILRLLEAPNTTTPEGLRDRAVLEVLYSTAMRNGELRALDLESVDLVRKEVRVEYGKGAKGRLLPLGEPACEALEAYLAEGRPWLVREVENGALFLNRLGRRMRGEMVSDLVKRWSEESGLSLKVTPHRIRHCCATHMLARKAGLRHLQQLLGHASADTTRRYTRVEISDLREEHRRCHPREA